MSRRVLAVMLANGRQEMVQRAIRSFASQTYPERHLLIFDSGPVALPVLEWGIRGAERMSQVRRYSNESIGSLRNHANTLATPGALDCDLIAHWDSDDVSHPERLTEQVAMLEATGADCVGYRDMLFWDGRAGGGGACFVHAGVDGGMLAAPKPRGEAWQFRSPNPAYILGTSMLYTRKIWERFPFKDRASAEDTLWLMDRRIKKETTCSISIFNGALLTECPRMIAGLHDGNTCSMAKPGAAEWTRAERWDEFCRETMKL